MYMYMHMYLLYIYTCCKVYHETNPATMKVLINVMSRCLCTQCVWYKERVLFMMVFTFHGVLNKWFPCYMHYKQLVLLASRHHVHVGK